MAIRNFIFNGSYTTVTNVEYDFKRRHLSFVIDVHNSKEEKTLFSIPYFLDGKNIKVLRDINMNRPPTHLNNGDCFHVGPEPDDIFKEFVYSMAQFDDRAKAFSFLPMEEGGLYFVKSLNKSCIYTDGEFTETDAFSRNQWDQLFSPAVLKDEGIELIKAIYDYLLTKPEFQNAEGDE